MKKIILTNIVDGVRKLAPLADFFEHMENSYVEALADLLAGLVAGTSSAVKLYGVVNGGAGTSYNITAGTIFHNGEIFKIDAFVGVATGGNVPVLSLQETASQLEYTDLTFQDTLNNRKYQWSFGASHSGLADYSEVKTFAEQLNTKIGLNPGIKTVLLTGAWNMDANDFLAINHGQTSGKIIFRGATVLDNAGTPYPLQGLLEDVTGAPAACIVLNNTSGAPGAPTSGIGFSKLIFHRRVSGLFDSANFNAATLNVIIDVLP